MIEFLSKIEKGRKLIKYPKSQTILFHYKNPENFSHNCSMRLRELRMNAIGHNVKQSQYRTWIDWKRESHNCSPWFEHGYEKIAKNSKVLFIKEMANIKQKVYTVCQAGCFDCHYSSKRAHPTNLEVDSHAFTKKVLPLRWYGGGRRSIFPAGTLVRRRFFIGKKFSDPKSLCIDCHENQAINKKHKHGEIKRKTDCSKCLYDGLNFMTKFVHKISNFEFTFEACQIQNVAWYAATFWGP